MFSLLLLAACRPPFEPEEGTVIVLVMDGVRLQDSLGDGSDTFDGTAPSHVLPRVWSEMVPQGSRSVNAWNTAATLTVPAHTEMALGRPRPLGNYPNSANPGPYRPDLPTWWEELRQVEDLDRLQVTVAANATILQPIAHGISPEGGYAVGANWLYVTEGDDDYQPAIDDVDVATATLGRMRDQPARSLLGNFRGVDRATHYGGREVYGDLLRDLDPVIADFWASLSDSPGYGPRTWLFVLADHGRHNRGTEDPTWRHHGCSCSGCRRIPFLALGPGIREGSTVTDLITLSDLAPTAAALLGLEVPWAQGFVLEELFETAPVGGLRSGVARVAVSGGHVAQVEYLPDRAHRTRLVLDGVPMSDPDATEVDAPTLASQGDQVFACWRELDLSTDPSPWLGHCVESTDGGVTWQDMGFPAEEVSAFWEPALLPDGQGGVYLAHVHNPNSIVTAGADGVVGLGISWYRGAWYDEDGPSAPSFPLDPAVVRVDGELVLAVAGGGVGNLGRYQRDIYLYAAKPGEGVGSWHARSPTGLALVLQDAPEEWRIEHPALHVAADGGLELAAVATWSEGGDAIVARSWDRGATWSEAGTLPIDLPVLPHLEPAWLGDTPVFGFLSNETSSIHLCRGDQASVSCIDTGSPRVLEVAADGDTLYALVDEGVGSWTMRIFDVAEFG